MSHRLIKQLTKNALLGTNRLDAQTQAKPRVAHAGVGRIIAQLDTSDPAHELLATAGVVAIHTQIGRSHLESGRLFEPNFAPEPTKPVCPPDVATLFEQVRRRGDLLLLRQMLEMIQEKGWRLPSDTIPDLLKLGSRNNLIRPSVINVLDNFGRWMAAQKSDWHYALLPVLTWDERNKMWLDAPQKIRISMLNWLRQNDPATGLDLLEARWPNEPDANRHALLNALRHRLSMADEPFIEHTLDARQMIIRKRAHELLSMLPDSRLSKRMERYAAVILTWHTDKSPFVTVRVPSNMSAAMQRDGFKTQFEKRRVDFVTKRLLHLISCTPLDYWSRTLDMTPAEFVALVQQTNWPRTFLGGLTTAAMRQNRSDWGKAILDGAGLSPKTGLALKAIHLTDINDLVDTALRHPLSDGKLVFNHPLYVLLKEWKGEWPDEAALKIGERLADYIRSEAVKNVPNASLRGWLTTLIAKAPAGVCQKFEAMFSFEDEVHTLWTSAIEKGLRQNEARRKIEAALGQITSK